ncbi:MAG: metallophosphoesterase [Candidatus Nanohaloarchaea archaeon]
MNKNVVKELTKQGCIVAKEAAEEITPRDVENIKQLDSTPMYISKTMIEALRSKENGELESSGDKIKDDGDKDSSEPLETDSSETVVTHEDVTEGKEIEMSGGTKTVAKQRTEPEDHDKGEISGEEKDVGGHSDKSSSESSTRSINIMDKRSRKDLRTKVEILDEKEVSRDQKDVPEFLKYYNDRYEKMRKLLMRRVELKAATTLNRLERRDKGDEATTVGIVKDKYQTNSGKWIVNLEDKTTTFKILAGERDGQMIVPDEVIGVIGSMGGDILYADSIVRADMPIPQGVKTTEEKVKAAYISDLHMGSRDTMHDQLDKFGEWLSSDEAKDIGYLVITGDIVEGVGTYPGQEEELEVKDIYKQYGLFEDWVEKLPEQMQILVGPGNHDITRLAEPQPRLPEKVFPKIKDFNNVHLVQNPQSVRLHGIESEGIVNLMYHGYSFDGHADQLQNLRKVAYQEPHHVMIDLLKRRHLAPTYGTNSLSPEGEDHMVIQHKPDIFVSGHFHSHSNESYKGVNVINSSTFQAQTDFQKRVGHKPDPGKVTIVDYKTRDTEVKKFI